MDKFERLVTDIMKDFEKDGEPITREQAITIAKMEIDAKELKTYVKGDEKTDKKPKKPKTVKVSDEKVALFDLLWEGLSNYYENTEILTQNKLISVEIGGKRFKIDVIECRK